MFFVGVQLDISQAPGASRLPAASAAAAAAAALARGDGSPRAGHLGLAQRMAHKSVTGAVRVAVRGRPAPPRPVPACCPRPCPATPSA